MMNVTEFAVAGFERLAGLQVRRCLQRVRQLAEELAALGGDEVVAKCQQFVSAPKMAQTDSSANPLHTLQGVELTDRDAEALALAAEAFSRFPPANLPVGSRLYAGQLLTAVHLLRGAIVQMDTGEGKTFAISTAALALLRTHGRVYIVTANPYLAARDANQTRHFWNELGITVGLALPSDYRKDDPRDWGSQVVYTTLEAMAFRNLWEDLGEVERLMNWSAVLLDEADAILLEQIAQPFWAPRAVDAGAKDWSQALGIARSLEERHVRVGSALAPSANLTADGEAEAIARADAHQWRLVDRLLLIHDVELAYTAIHVARLGHDYDVQSDQVVTIDPSSGWHTMGVEHAWVAPLEQHLGLEGQPRSVVRQVIDGITLLRRFSHIAGASGTVVNEALDYALLLGLPPAVVRPRKPRLDGRLPDLVAISRERAHSWVVEQVEEHGPKRPVLVATDSTKEAKEIARELSAAKIEGVVVRAVSAETIAGEQVFERAGEPGITIVSTRTAGRGVDIPLKPAAYENGGAMLLAMGHSPEARLDRQLLGRVGRQGQPYSARFISHPDETLLQGAMKLKTTLKIAPDGVVENRSFDFGIARAQRRVRRERLQRFANGVTEGKANGELYNMLRLWRQRMGTRGEGDLPASFLAFLADRHIGAKYPGLQSSGFAEPEIVAAEVCNLVDRPEDEESLKLEILGQPAPEARKALTEYLADALDDSQRVNREAREEMVRRLADGERAVLDIRLLQFLRMLLRADGGDADWTATHAMRGALAVAGAAVPANTSGAAVARRFEDVEHWLDGAAEGTEDGLRELQETDMASDDALGRLLGVVSTLSLEPDGGNSSSRHELEELIRQAEASRGPAPDAFDEQWAARSRRSAWEIAAETVDQTTQRVVTGIDRVRFQVSQTVRPTRYGMTYLTRVDDLRREIEATLATEMCANLVSGADPGGLDDLFEEREHTVVVRRPRMKLELPALPPPEPAMPVLPAPAVSTESATLIIEYIEAVRERLGDDAPDPASFVPALKALLKGSDPTAMTDPDRVATAYETWKGSATRGRLSPWHRRAADRHVREFLLFLHGRGLAARLPTGLRQRSLSLARRARRVLLTPGFVLAVGALALAALAGGALALAPNPGDGFAPSPALGFLERLLTAGSLSAGSALGPILLALLGGAWFRWLLGYPTTSDAGVNPLERTVSLSLLLAGAAIVVQPWNEGLSLQAAGALGTCVLLVVVGLSMRNGSYWFEQMAHYHLSALMAAGFACLSALPLLAQLGGAGRVWPIAGCSAVVLAASTPIRRAHIHALALRIDRADSGELETLDVPLVARGRLSIVPHAFALGFAWAISCVVIEAGPATRSIVAGLVYIAVLAFWARSLARSATDLETWQKQMREQQRAYEPTGEDLTLEDALISARRRVFLLEMAAAIPVVAFGTYMAVDAPADALSRLPLGMAAIFATVIVLDLGRAFGRSLRSPLAGFAEPSPNATYGDAEGIGAYAGEVVRHLAKRMGAIIAILGALGWISNAVSIVQLLEQAYEWLSTR